MHEMTSQLYVQVYPPSFCCGSLCGLEPRIWHAPLCLCELQLYTYRQSSRGWLDGSLWKKEKIFGSHSRFSTLLDYTVSCTQFESMPDVLTPRMLSRKGDQEFQETFRKT